MSDWSILNASIGRMEQRLEKLESNYEDLKYRIISEIDYKIDSLRRRIK